MSYLLSTCIARSLSRERAIAFMKANTFEADAQIDTESLRYSVDMPGQALAYKLGALAIKDARERVRAIPDGLYEAESFMDDDGISVGQRVPIRVKVIVSGSDMTIDLSGCSPEREGGANSRTFAGAYIAEIIRGGLQSLPKGQFEAADAMGLNYVQKTLLIILPQALRVVIPPLINTFIGFFKDTSLVLIIGIFDFLNTANQALVDPNWAGFPGEVYLFAAFIYFIFCFSMSRYSKYLEIELNKGTRR